MVDWHERGDSVPISAGKLGLIYDVAGRRAAALEELGILEALAKKKYVPPTAFALVHAGLGNMMRLSDGWTERSRSATAPSCCRAPRRPSTNCEPIRASKTCCGVSDRSRNRTTTTIDDHCVRGQKHSLCRLGALIARNILLIGEFP